MNNFIKFSLVLLYCSYFGLTSALSCISCTSEHTPECKLNAGSLINNTDLQVSCATTTTTCFSKIDGTKISRGCSTDAICKDGTVTGCKVCPDNNCNIKNHINCYSCTSDKDYANCTTFDETIPTAECSDSKGCVEYIDDKNFTVRGCLTDDIEKNCTKGNCKICDDEKCNKDIHIICIRCRGDFTDGYYCNDAPIRITNTTFCDSGYFLSKDSKCYSRKVGSNTFRGCLDDLSEDLQGKCSDEKFKDCVTCSGRSCNMKSFNGAVALSNKNVFLWTVLITFAFAFLYK